ncbi:hypothetical protein ACNSOL_12135 (plasmid) [Aliarcobacter lanthieri]|uniref:hypothetical protein n=1 Tax=Aliarcobacter lanthieri TaxID=1355374 RepID=UPI003AAA86B9
MKQLDKQDLELLDNLVKSEVSIIEKGFEQSVPIGKIFFSNALTSFKKEYLEKRYGITVIPALSTKYRYLLIGILQNINQKYLSDIFEEAVVPEYKSISTEQLLSCLKLKNMEII